MAELKFEKTTGLSGIEYRAHGERTNYRVYRQTNGRSRWLMEASKVVMVGNAEPVRISGDILTVLQEATRADAYEAANLYEAGRNR